MAETMVGRKVLFNVKKTLSNPKELVLSVKNIVVNKNETKKHVDKISFDVRAGEIVTLAGIEGNGQSQLIKAITGLIEPDSGKIIINKVDATKKSIRNKIELGMSHIPEDRQKDGLILDYPLKNNFIICEYYLDKFQKNGFLNFEKIDNYADSLIAKYDVRSSAGKNSLARGMSGGNQQKAIIAREIDLNGQCLLCVQLTRGLDVGAIEYIHSQLLKQRELGKAILLISLELDEIMKLSDQILVMFEGKIVAKLDPKSTTQEMIGEYMAGARSQHA
jgi:simple sugar transport system ATP-binding protein